MVDRTPYRKGEPGLSLPSNDLMAAIAATRFGLGARPGEIEAARSDPRGFLQSQIRREGADLPRDDGESAPVRYAAFADLRQERRAARQDARMVAGDDTKSIPVVDAPNRNAKSEAQKDVQRYIREKTTGDFLARAQLATDTETSFRERWALFFANHFTVSQTKQAASIVIGPFEREAIRPHAFGRFEDMLLAASTHAAMLTYLDQAQSVGPGSPAARYQTRKGRRTGLNENLAREILELHTVGVDAGYSQADVTEFARALTGFSIGRAQDPDIGAFVFRANTHEPGARSILGKAYAQSGENQGLSVLKALAADPRTARHVCGKIARHFVADDPPPALVKRLETRWIETGGQLDEVAKALIEAPEAWDPTPTKIKTPYEFVISTWRAVGGRPAAFERLNPILISLGQKPFSPPSPKGWPDEAGAWASPDGLVKRMQWTQGFAAAVADTRDPDALARSALGARLSEPTARAVARAETRREAFALLVMSPEFQRR
ncbi:DUF1800 domain-containing protein [Caulobacter flavus]|uniref:DUF1800 domain-containing protein n=1 Tax=Caulobacter flavus TaxID=1679497 RepID=A0A2N5CKX4_9CAUL|nr:DUF1800 domain-containing protein [Caulobacter flavus]PLR06218.1 DUF1800 domain-containing protein [Caulobacter flavus]